MGSNSHRPRYLFLVVPILLLLVEAIPTTHSLGFTNIFGVIHHKTDEEAKQMNDFLEQEDTNGEHYAWFPQGSSMLRSIQDVSDTDLMIRRNRNTKNKKNKKKILAARRFPPMDDDEFLELLLHLQD
ncbi:hypothetical protein IV203_030711 [Nitzschia inconspicua]|uniref:Uncharacterized protein n=1 Tax=Nitzschia inconspicua TaxID=303405 RepID=A0A9K3LU06_9STRA|nr:hypothetical protein IV203_030711 [Nitzschia inconspicua]